MALNASNASHLFPLSSFLSVYDLIFMCYRSEAGLINMTLYTIISILLLPVYVQIIRLAYQRWRRSNTGTSHFDLITYQVVVTELLNIVGCVCYCCGICAGISEMVAGSVYFLPFKLSAQMLFHILTCLEQYLAVVHPVIYLGLRTGSMIRIRNIIIGCVWVLCVTSVCTVYIVDELSFLLLSCCTNILAVLVISFFSISVLCALVQSKPGEGGSNGQRVHQTKLRAFHTIISILGLLLLRCGSNFLTMIKAESLLLWQNARCGIFMTVPWLCLPSSLVLPLMFLQRSGKLPRFRKNKDPAKASD